MKKGIVMELTKSWTVVLTSDGEFIKIPFQPDHREGGEVAFLHPLEPSKSMKNKRWSRPIFRGGAIVAACLLIFLTSLPFFGKSESYAAVTIDINPSVELSVDKEGRVIQVDSYSDEGESLLKEVVWKDESLPIVTLNIIDQAKLMGYFAEQRRVLITTTYLHDERTENIRKLLAENFSVNDDLTVVLIEGDKEMREEAKEKQISLGLLMLERVSRQEGFQLTGDSASDWDVSVLPAVQGIEVIEFKDENEKTDEQEPLNMDESEHRLDESKQLNERPQLKQVENQPLFVEQNSEQKESKEKDTQHPHREQKSYLKQKHASEETRHKRQRIKEKRREEIDRNQSEKGKRSPGHPDRSQDRFHPVRAKSKDDLEDARKKSGHPERSQDRFHPVRVKSKDDLEDARKKSGPPVRFQERLHPARAKDKDRPEEAKRSPGPPVRPEDQFRPRQSNDKVSPSRTKNSYDRRPNERGGSND